MIIRWSQSIDPIKSQFRALSNIFEVERPPNFTDFRTYLHELQANRSAKQSEISKLSLFYRNLSHETLTSSHDHLNNALYFSSIFSKKLPPTHLKLAEEQVKFMDDSVLRALAQKLLTSNQWHVADKLINLKFESDESLWAIKKFEIFALNGNYLKMVEQLPIISKSSGIPQQVQLNLLCLLNSKDGNIRVDYSDVDVKWGKLLLLGMKGRVLSSNPPTLETFVRLIEPLSGHFEISPSLLALGFSKCSNDLSEEAAKLLRLIYKRLSCKDLVDLAARLNSTVKTNLNEDVVIALLEGICKNPPLQMKNSVMSSLLCWIIEFFPEKYNFHTLLTEFPEIINSSVAKHALQPSRLYDSNCIKFIEFCVIEKGIQIDREVLKVAIDIANERDGFIPSSEFMRSIHQNGYILSSKFYLNRLIQLNSQSNLPRSFACFKLINSNDLHGELLQSYLRVSEELLEKCVAASNLDYCYKIHQRISKYQVIKTLESPKPFQDFVMENYEQGKFSQPFKPTNNLECIRVLFNCLQTSRKNEQDYLSEKFCSSLLKVSLTNLDFSLSKRISVYMCNLGYRLVDSNSIERILAQWMRTIHNK